jgi:O-antigen ligase
MISLAFGIFKPHLLIFSLSLAASLEVSQNYYFTPMRIVILFAGVALILRGKKILGAISKIHLLGLTYCAIYFVWCLLCVLVRQDTDNLVNAFTTFVYTAICFLLFIVVDKKYSIPTYIWLGLGPTVISSILATMHLRVVEGYEYLLTPAGLRYRGIVNDPNYLSSILLVGFTTCLVCLGTKKGIFNKLIYLAITAAFFLAVWAPQSRAGIYTAGICLFLFILLQVGFDLIKIRFWNILLMSLVGIITFAFIMENIQSRVFSIARWEGVAVVRGYTKEAVIETLKYPVVGPGEANFIKRYGVAAHNTLISIGLEYGIVGMSLMIIAIFFSFYNLWKHRSNGALLFFFPLLALNIILCSFSSPGHKLFWFYLVAAFIFQERILSNGKADLVTCSQ